MITSDRALSEFHNFTPSTGKGYSGVSNDPYCEDNNKCLLVSSCHG